MPSIITFHIVIWILQYYFGHWSHCLHPFYKANYFTSVWRYEFICKCNEKFIDHEEWWMDAKWIYSKNVTPHINDFTSFGVRFDSTTKSLKVFGNTVTSVMWKFCQCEIMRISASTRWWLYMFGTSNGLNDLLMNLMDFLVLINDNWTLMQFNPFCFDFTLILYHLFRGPVPRWLFDMVNIREWHFFHPFLFHFQYEKLFNFSN